MSVDVYLKSRSKITKSKIPSKSYIDIISLHYFCKTVLFLPIHKNNAQKKEPERRYFADLFFPCPEFHCVVVTEDKSPQIFFPTTNTQKKVIRMATEKAKKIDVCD